MAMKKNKISLKMPTGYSKLIHATILALNLFGVVMIISASMSTTSTTQSLMVAGIKEFIFVIISYILMVFVARNFSMKLFGKYFYFILGITAVMLFVPLAFSGVNGAKAWIQLPFMTIQPSEFTKIIVILTVAYTLGDKRGERDKKWWQLLMVPVLFILFAVGVITVLQSDLGSAVVILGIGYLCILIPSNSKLTKTQKWMFGLLLFAFAFLFFIDTPFGFKMIESIFTKIGKPYMLARFQTSSDPLHDIYGNSMQIFYGLVSMTKGGWFGLGYGNSLMKYGYIPEANTDFILAIVIEELGIVGFGIIIVGYGILIYNMFKYAFKVKSEKDKIILVGTAAYIMIHFFFNVGGLSAFIPLTGVPLLFISSGGSSRLAIMIAIGLVQNVIARYHREQTLAKQKKVVQQ